MFSFIRKRLLCTLLVSLVLSAAGSRAGGQRFILRRSEAIQPEVQRRALLVGISDYDRGTNPEDRFGKLSTGPDISNMTYVLKTYYSFSEANIRVIQNERATQGNIVREFQQQLIDKAKPGDQVLFYYTGHGHYVVDTSGDETTDKLDEVLVTWVPKEQQTLAAAKRHALMYMLDDTYEKLLQQLAQKMKGADGKVVGSITVIFDSCHSGSGIKGMLVAKGRGWDEKIDGPLPAAAGSNEVASGWLSRKDPFDGVVFLSASQSGQLSYMMPGSGDKGSILTYNLAEFLTNVARDKSLSVSYKQLFDSIAPKIAGMRANQNPQIEGALNTLLFGDGKPVNAEPLPLVRRVITGPPLRLELSEGLLHGITKGSRFDIYRSGKSTKDPANKLAELEITDVESITSIGKVTTNGTATPQPDDYAAAQAVATEIHFEGEPLRVLIQSGLPSDKAKALADVVEGQAFLTRTEVGETNFDVRLGWCVDTNAAWCKDRREQYFFQQANGSAISLGSMLEVPDLRKRLLADWRWKRLAGLTLPGPSKVRIEMTSKDGSPLKRTEGGRIVLRPGDTVRVSCTNNTGAPMFISLIYLKHSGDIEVYPGPDVENAQQALNADNKPVTLFELSDVSAPNGKEVEILKIIATPREASFTGLHFVGGGRRGNAKGPKNPMEDLLFGIVDANAKSGTIKSVEINNWYTDQIVYEINPH